MRFGTTSWSKIKQAYYWVLSKLSNRFFLYVTVPLGVAIFAFSQLKQVSYLWSPWGAATLSYFVWILTFAAAIAAFLAMVGSIRAQGRMSGFSVANVILIFAARGLTPVPSVPPGDTSRIQMAIASTNRPLIDVSRREQRIAKGMELPQNDDEEIAEGKLVLGKFGEAIDHFSVAEANLANRLAAIHFSKARTYWALAQSDDAFFDKALYEANLSLGFRPTYSPALVIKCISLRQKNKLDEALRACDDSVKADKNNEGAWNARGATLILIGDEAKNGRPYYENALADLDIGIKVRPTRELWANEAVAFESLDSHQDALRAANESLRLSPDFANALLIKGIILKSLKDLSSAVEIYQKLTSLNPYDAEAWNDLGNASWLNQDTAGALIYFDKALYLNPRLVEALFNKGKILNGLDRNDEAIEPLSAVCEMRPNDAEAHYQLAFALYKTHRDADALSAASKAVRLRSGYKSAKMLRRAILSHSDVTLDNDPAQ